MPLARQEKFFARHGIEIPRSTLTDWMLALGLAVAPLIERMGELLKGCAILGSDDTPLPWQNGRAGKTTTARLWVWRGQVDAHKPLLVYQFTADRSGTPSGRLPPGLARLSASRCLQWLRRPFCQRQDHRSRLLRARAPPLL